MRTLSVKLNSGSDLLQSLRDIALKEDSYGYVLSVVGNLSEVYIQCPGNIKANNFNGNLEIITLNGTISPNNSHLHLSISDEKCNVWGGHLELGTVVLKEVEVLLGFNASPVPKSTKILDNSDKSIVDIFTLPGCPWCKRSLLLLQKSNISYTVHTIENDSQFSEINKKTNISTFPQIFVEGNFIGGYENLAEFLSSYKIKK